MKCMDGEEWIGETKDTVQETKTESEESYLKFDAVYNPHLFEKG
jgi:hypothetical protein